MALAPLPVLLNLRLLVCSLLIAATFIPGFVFVLANDETHLVLATLTFSYQAARRDCLRRALAWAPAGALVGLVSGPPHVGLWVVLVAAAYSAGIALLAAGAYRDLSAGKHGRGLHSQLAAGCPGVHRRRCRRDRCPAGRL
jgi:hypothetical protein